MRVDDDVVLEPQELRDLMNYVLGFKRRRKELTPDRSVCGEDLERRA